MEPRGKEVWVGLKTERHFLFPWAPERQRERERERRKEEVREAGNAAKNTHCLLSHPPSALLIPPPSPSGMSKRSTRDKMRGRKKKASFIPYQTAISDNFLQRRKPTKERP